MWEVLEQFGCRSQDVFACGWKSGCFETLVNPVQDDIRHWHLWQSENLLQRFGERFVVGDMTRGDGR